MLDTHKLQYLVFTTMDISFKDIYHAYSNDNNIDVPRELREDYVPRDLREDSVRRGEITISTNRSFCWYFQ